MAVDDHTAAARKRPLSELLDPRALGALAATVAWRQAWRKWFNASDRIWGLRLAREQRVAETGVRGRYATTLHLSSAICAGGELTP